MRTSTIIHNKRQKTMAETIRARFANGVLEPFEHLDVSGGEVLTITIIRVPVNEGGGCLECSAGGWNGLIDAEELKRNIDADRMISTRPEPRL
jgi:hypothetical protein